jgi:glutathionyl-hydroquinone reductase
MTEQPNDDVVIFDSSLTLHQLRAMWNYMDEEDFVDFTPDELHKLAEDINDAIHNVIEDFLNHRSN